MVSARYAYSIAVAIEVGSPERHAVRQKNESLPAHKLTHQIFRRVLDRTENEGGIALGNAPSAERPLEIMARRRGTLQSFDLRMEVHDECLILPLAQDLIQGAPGRNF